MKKAIVIDDEFLARNMVKECLLQHTEIEIIAECADGFEGIKAIQELKPDLIFLDIQMPRINGFEMLELIDEPPSVIFATAFDEFALKAFEANAIDYLLKPFSQIRFDQAIKKFLQNANIGSIEKLLKTEGKSEFEASRVVVKHHGNIRIIPAIDILYIEAWDDYVKIHTAENVFVKKQTLTFYENALSNKDFLRVHRSFLVNISQVTSIDQGSGENRELRLRNGFHLPVSRSGYQKLKVALGI